MKIISCVGAKGGSGKSSVAMLLAWELSRNHKNKVALLDADIQGTCISAKKLNQNLPFEVISISNKTELWETGKQLEKEKYDYLIIDGNPRSIHEDPSLIEVIAKLSDLSLIVSRPSPRDLKAQIKYLEAARKATTGEIRLLWNFFQKNTAAHRAGVPEGEKLLGVKSIKTRVGLRVAYQDIGYAECYVGDLGNKEAAVESRALGNEIKELLR
jgi:cellulose biosynthesis protein BcsQ